MAFHEKPSLRDYWAKEAALNAFLQATGVSVNDFCSEKFQSIKKKLSIFST